MAPHKFNRKRLLALLSSPEPILRDEDYPEFRDGSEAWVRRLREKDLRLENEKLGDWAGHGSRVNLPNR
jgi:hypothetical protein